MNTIALLFAHLVLTTDSSFAPSQTGALKFLPKLVDAEAEIDRLCAAVEKIPPDAHRVLHLICPANRDGRVACVEKSTPTEANDAYLTAVIAAVNRAIAEHAKEKPTETFELALEVKASEKRVASSDEPAGPISQAALECSRQSATLRRLRLSLDVKPRPGGDVEVSLKDDVDEIAPCIAAKLRSQKPSAAHVNVVIDTGPLRPVVAREARGEALDPVLIKTVISAHRGAFDACHDRPASGAAPDGVYKIGFVINHDGAVSSAAATSSPDHGESVSACLVEVLKSLKFPKPNGRTDVRVNYPFVFRAHQRR